MGNYMKIQNLLYYTLIIFLSGCTQYHQAESMSDRLPLIYPDYTDVTFPINIAPPNFRIQEEGEAFQTELGCGEENYDILIQDDEPIVRIPESEWKVLLEKAAGKKYMSELLLSSMANGYVILIFRIVYPFMR